MRKLSDREASFFEKCPKCGCKFNIDKPEDIRTIEKAPEVQYVSCPDCQYMIGVHIAEEDIKSLDILELLKMWDNIEYGHEYENE